MHTQSRDLSTAAALKFFNWAYAHGQQLAEQLDYVPIPANVVKLVEARWHQSLQVDGRPVWPTKSAGAVSALPGAGRSGVPGRIHK